MKVKSAYNLWAQQYDTNKNRTRDLEALSLQLALADYSFQNCLEIGCGTGKNTQYLLTKATCVTAIDFSEEMLSRAKNKITSQFVNFVQADINEEWAFFSDEKFDLITFSLVLEHIENLELIFEKALQVIQPGGTVYIGELHPFKQYSGTKARFDTDAGKQEVTCFTHHISDFLNAAEKKRFELVKLSEHFDDLEKEDIPRTLSLILKAK